ncbi:hypothetical protein [Plantactinospora sp. B5E13]|uniref:hypothetical protein n=1 Tax=Plantactinospora sp. B5E13 TaxID=3153758 RepID=UPI00325D461E
MIVGSLLLILVAVTLLVLGLAIGSSGLLISSIAASLLAAVALVVGARQAATGRGGLVGDEPFGDDGMAVGGDGEVPGGARPRRPPTNTRVAPTDARVAGGHSTGPAATVLTEPLQVPVPAQTIRSGAALDDSGWRQPAGGSAPTGTGPDGQSAEDDPGDEPAAQRVSPVDAAAVATLTAEVYVVDGRPRYHLADCPHLDGRQSEPLPVGEAAELGFTPCGRCEPASTLLADAPPR